MQTGSESKARDRYLRRSNLPLFPEAPPLLDFKHHAPVHDFIAQCSKGVGGRGLMLFGSPGRGKTLLARAILTEVLTTSDPAWLGRNYSGGGYDAYRPGYFLRHTEFIDTHHASWREDEDAEVARDLLRSLYFRSSQPGRNTRVLVLDDIGKENPLVGTGHKTQVLDDVIRTRFSKGAPTILTTNLNPDELKGTYGEATASFMREGFAPVKIDGPDRRP